MQSQIIRGKIKFSKTSRNVWYVMDNIKKNICDVPIENVESDNCVATFRMVCGLPIATCGSNYSISVLDRTEILCIGYHSAIL